MLKSNLRSWKYIVSRIILWDSLYYSADPYHISVVYLYAEGVRVCNLSASNAFSQTHRRVPGNKGARLVRVRVMDSSAASEVISGLRNSLEKVGLLDLPLGAKRPMVAYMFSVSASRTRYWILVSVNELLAL